MVGLGTALHANRFSGLDARTDDPSASADLETAAQSRIDRCPTTLRLLEQTKRDTRIGATSKSAAASQRLAGTPDGRQGRH